MSAAMALQKAVHARLAGDAALVALVGPGGISDRLTVAGALPWVQIAAIDSRDWSTGTEGGEEHRLTLEAHSGEGGHRTVQQIAGIVHLLLHDATLTLEGFALINLQHRTTRIRREARAKGHVAEMVFRAVTE